MFAPELSTETRQLLAEVTPGFQENLIRAFKNEGVRRQAQSQAHTKAQTQKHAKAQKELIKLDDVLIEHEGNVIELRGLQLRNGPDFRVGRMEVDLSTLNVEVELNIGDVVIESTYEGNHRSLRKIFPVSYTGIFAHIFKNLTAKGNVGLILRSGSDSFIPKNYDIEYIPGEIRLVASNYSDKGKLKDDELTGQTIESTLVKTIWGEFTERLTEMFSRQFGAVMVEFSVSEMLGDNDSELRALSRHQVGKANRLMSSLLCAAKDYVVSNNTREVEFPGFIALFKGKTIAPVHQGVFETKKGYIQDLSTLTKIEDMAFYEDKRVATVYGNLQINVFKHGYESFHAEYQNVEVNGKIRGTVYRNKIFVKIALDKTADGCKPRLDRVKLVLIKDINTNTSTLASLAWLTQQVEDWVTSSLRYTGIPALERCLAEAFRYAVENTNCEAIAID